VQDLRYPIGKFAYSEPDRAAWLKQIATLPTELRSAVDGMNDDQLDTPYRDSG